MADIQKICNALEKAKGIIEQWIPMFEQYNTPSAIDDAIELLKEQEAVEPYVTGRGETFETAETWWYACGNCHEALDVNDKYCRHCGRPVKWE